MIPYSRPKLSYFFHLYLFKTLKKRGHTFQNIGNKIYNIFPDPKISLASFAWKPYPSQGYIAVQPTKKRTGYRFANVPLLPEIFDRKHPKSQNFQPDVPCSFPVSKWLQSMLGNSNFPNYFPQSGSHSQLSLSLRQNE